MRPRTLYRAERVGDESVFATDPRHSKYEQAKREREEREAAERGELDPDEVMTRATALALIEEAERWQKACAEARDARERLIEAGTTLADIAARACTEPRRFHENEGDYQQALSLAVARWRGLAATESAQADEDDLCPGCGGDASDSVFDRSICACGSMHYYCASCGAQLDPCR